MRSLNILKEAANDTFTYLLLPMIRSLVTNWKFGNSREAGVALTHVIGSGHKSSMFINSMSGYC